MKKGARHLRPSARMVRVHILGSQSFKMDKHHLRLNAPCRQDSSASSSERQWQEGRSSVGEKGYGGSGRLPG